MPGLNIWTCGYTDQSTLTLATLIYTRAVLTVTHSLKHTHHPNVPAGEIIVTSIMCNLVPFALLRFGLPWAYHGDHFIGRFLRPIHPSYFTESPWRYVGGRILLLSHYWTVVLSACVFTLVVFALPFIIILGIVLDGNTKPMDTGVWAGIMAAWGAFVHTCAFVTALLWNAAHRLRPLCEREKLIQTKRAEKAAKKQGTGTTQPACNSLEGYAKDTAEGAMGVAPGPLEERDGSVRITMSIRDTDDKKLPIISVPPAAVSPQSV